MSTLVSASPAHTLSCCACAHRCLWAQRAHVPIPLALSFPSGCPTELEMFDPAYNSFVINGVSEFTVFVRMNVNYRTFKHHTHDSLPADVQEIRRGSRFVFVCVAAPAKFGITLDNTGHTNTTTNFTNLWTLKEMVNLAGWGWGDVQRYGTMLGMNAVWNCDFDKGTDQCAPTISFVRLDDPSSKLSSGSVKIADALSGCWFAARWLLFRSCAHLPFSVAVCLPVSLCSYNFRSIEYMHDKYGARQLTKHYGVRLLVMISGIGSKFDVAALFTAIGAGIGLLSVATLIADFIATNLLSNKAVYKQAKYKEVEVADEAAAAALAAANAGETTGVMIGSSSTAAGTDPAVVRKSSQGVNNPDLTTPLRVGFTNNASLAAAAQREKRPSDGKLHIADRYDDEDDDEDEGESWGRAHYPKK